MKNKTNLPLNYLFLHFTLNLFFRTIAQPAIMGFIPVNLILQIRCLFFKINCLFALFGNKFAALS